MTDYCAFTKDRKCILMNSYCPSGCGRDCIKWQDYSLMRSELEETEELCHGNWIEIQRLRNWADALVKLLEENGINAPDEFEFDSDYYS